MTVKRRAFIQTGAALGASLIVPRAYAQSKALPNEDISIQKDSLPMQLYKSLNDEQQGKVCLPSSDVKRDYINNWWYVLPAHRLDNTFTQDQRVLIQDIVDSWHSEEHREGIRKQITEDQNRKQPSVAFFGKLEDLDFEMVFSGHHVTRRGLVNSLNGGGFGGRPIFYGNFGEKFRETKDHPGNPYWYQGLAFNRFLKTLDGSQRQKILVDIRPRSEKPELVIKKKEANFPGMPVSNLSKDQQEELKTSMKEMLAMFRSGDVTASMDSIHKSSIFDQLHISTYGGKFDIGGDGVYDTFQIEGPDMVWYFRGQPHIHCYLHIKDSVIPS
jgi:hypothetical protein